MSICAPCRVAASPADAPVTRVLVHARVMANRDKAHRQKTIRTEHFHSQTWTGRGGCRGRVFQSACAGTYAHTCMPTPHACICPCIHACLPRMHAYAHACMHACMRWRIQQRRTPAVGGVMYLPNTTHQLCVRARERVYACARVRARACVQVCVRARVCTCAAEFGTDAEVGGDSDDHLFGFGGTSDDQACAGCRADRLPRGFEALSICRADRLPSDRPLCGASAVPAAQQCPTPRGRAGGRAGGRGRGGG